MDLYQASDHRLVLLSRARPGVDKTLAAWVYIKHLVIYVYLFTPHTQLPSIDHGQPKDFPGEWWGPVEMTN